MRRVLLATLAAILAAALVVLVWIPNHVHARAGDVARSLGLRIEDFEGPAVSGTLALGTRGYHWQRMESSRDADGIDVLPLQGLACWWSRRDGIVTRHGCVRP